MLEKALRRKLPSGCFQNVSRQRSENMRAIKGSLNTTTEQCLRLALVRAGLHGWKVRPRGLPGNPDFVFPERRVAIFADGCFWHGCPHCCHAPVRNNSAYWREKIKRNRARDQSNRRRLQTQGWRVLRIWEHELNRSPDKAIGRLQFFLTAKGRRNLGMRIRSVQSK
ncbi:MAG: very short patch repair endonuclease [Acidobacteria bacterium]|nr:very short patch repair endonuclease [Acidobacteriota bacterium]